MSNEQENQNPEEIQIITEEGNDNAEYLKNRKKTVGKYTETKKVEEVEITVETVLENKLSSITTMSVISIVFYLCSVLSIIGMFGYLSMFETPKNIEILSIQFLIICSCLGTAFTFFSFGKLFEVVNRIDKNTKK